MSARPTLTWYEGSKRRVRSFRTRDAAIRFWYRLAPVAHYSASQYERAFRGLMTAAHKSMDEIIVRVLSGEEPRR